jgi:hypothetical protein
VDINGSDEVGGLVERNHYGSTVSNSYSTGSVNDDGESSGGLVGYNAGIVSNSYSTSSVTATSMYAGGLVGLNLFSGTVSNSYSTGSVSGDENVGGYDLGRDYPHLENHTLLCVTEMNTRTEIDSLVEALQEVAS